MNSTDHGDREVGSQLIVGVLAASARTDDVLVNASSIDQFAVDGVLGVLFWICQEM